jgi:AraC-like DNA-binding protein
MGGRSDWLLHSDRLELTSSVPTEPSQSAIEAICAEIDEAGRRQRLAEHLRFVVGERSQPITADHRAYPAMELALWDNLHHPGTVAAMIRASGLSRAQAYRVFAACSGMSPARMVRRERLAFANHLLGDGIAAATVAQRCGFAGVRALRRALTGS